MRYDPLSEEKRDEPIAFPQTAASIFDPTVRAKLREMQQATDAMFSAMITARENAPRKVTGHETD